MRMLNYLPWSIFNFLSRPPNPTRILLPWFSPTNQKNFIFLSKVLNHGNWISCCCCWNSFGFQQKVLLDRIWPFSCLLFRSIPSQGNTAEIVLNVLHRNFLGVDEFLGMVSMPLRDFDVYERPKTKWVQF